ncbi:MAG: hypothetical protein LBU89_06735 [Fibromonadaceae bacterium]|jgi:hypothetical protein|nr:hypothetical protein [Fibromonadaceae bacterium]
MENTFDTQIAQIQTDLISHSLKFCENTADIIYIMTGCISGVRAGFEQHYGLFFRIDGVMRDFREMGTRELRNEAGENFSIGLSRLRKACKEHDRPIPIIMKLVYNTKTESLEIDYSYELPGEGIALSDIKNDWFKSLAEING